MAITTTETSGSEYCTSGTVGYKHPEYGLRGTVISSGSIEVPEGLTELKVYLQDNSTGVSCGTSTIGEGVEVVIPPTSKWHIYY
jgi:hypothetical protein